MKRHILSMMCVCAAIAVTGCSKDSNVKKAEEFVQVKMYAEALNVLQKEILEQPKNVDAHLLSAKIYLLQNDETKAREAFERAILIDTKQKRRVGEVYMALGDETIAQDEARAIAFYRAAARYDAELGAKIAQTLFRRAEELSQTARDAAKPLAYLVYCLEFDAGQRDKIAEFAMKTAKQYVEKDFTGEAMAYAQVSASLNPKYLNDVEALRRKFEPAAGATYTEPTTGMEFVYIPGGEFWMGCGERETECSDDEKPRHQARVNGFWMGKYEVTQAQWEKVMGNNPSKFEGADRPVEQVTWNDAQAFLKKLNATHPSPLPRGEQRETSLSGGVGGGSSPFGRGEGWVFRLPSEAEWEYAARAGTQTAYSFGDDPSQLGDYAWFGGNSGRETHPVGKKQPNAFGLYDMHGNVWEWVADTYHDNYDGAPNDGSIWGSLGDGKTKVLRGGSWFLNPNNCRSASRNRLGLDGWFNYIGARVVVGAR